MEKITEKSCIEQFAVLSEALGVAHQSASIRGEEDPGFCGFLDYFQQYAGAALKRDYRIIARINGSQNQTLNIQGRYFQKEGMMADQIPDAAFIKIMKDNQEIGLYPFEFIMIRYLRKTLSHIEAFRELEELEMYGYCTPLNIYIYSGVIRSYIAMFEDTLKKKGIDTDPVKEIDMPRQVYELEDTAWDLAV